MSAPAIAAVTAAVLAVSVLYNFLAAVGIGHVAAGRPHLAALADSALYVLGALCIASLVSIGWWVAFPELAGGYAGTYYGTKYAARRRSG